MVLSRSLSPRPRAPNATLVSETNAVLDSTSREEMVVELEAELDGVTGPEGLEGERRERALAELGDVLLAGAQLGNYLGMDPEGACRAAVRRFEERFRRMESTLGEGGVTGHPLARLIAAWEEAKANC